MTLTPCLGEGDAAAPDAALPLAAGGLAVNAVVVARIGGVSLADLLTRRIRFHHAQRAGWTRLSAGVLTDHPRGTDLPGILAPLQASDVDDGRGDRHALLHNRRTGTLTAILRCSRIGLDLVDDNQTDG